MRVMNKPVHAFADDAIKQMQWPALVKKNMLDAMNLAELVRYVRELPRQFGFTSP